MEKRERPCLLGWMCILSKERKEYTQGVINMKKKILAVATILCLAGTSTVFARGYGHGNHGGYSHGYSHGYSRGYSGGHHDNDLGIVLGVAGGLILGSALLYSAQPPPRTVVYDNPYPVYQPEVIVRQPRVCLEDRVVDGEWQVSRYGGRQIWVPYQYPVTRRVQVPCY